MSTYGHAEAALYKWLMDAHAENMALSGPIVLAKARDLGSVLGYNDSNQETDGCSGSKRGRVSRVKTLFVGLLRC